MACFGDTFGVEIIGDSRILEEIHPFIEFIFDPVIKLIHLEEVVVWINV